MGLRIAQRKQRNTTAMSGVVVDKESLSEGQREESGPGQQSALA
jgi:hypothetical protein